MFKEEKVENQKLHSAGSSTSKIDEFEDPYNEIWQKH
jgi:hypothetical protein